MQAVGYIIQDKQGNAIHGFGETVVEAWAMVKEGAGPFLTLDGDERDDDAVIVQDFKVYGATRGLLDLVAAEGGAIAWDVINGVACTRDEAAAAA